ncbi:hypothetical protein Drorol1_Dr00012424, partial [Drosera rotundifolia]
CLLTYRAEQLSPPPRCRRRVHRGLLSGLNRTFTKLQHSSPDSNIQITGSRVSFPDHVKLKLEGTVKSDQEVRVSKEERKEVVDTVSTVKVVVRIRPTGGGEKGWDRTVKKVSEKDIRIGDREFGFDSVLDASLGQVLNMLSRGSKQGKQEFTTEAKLLERVQHRNVVNLLGMSQKSPQIMIMDETENYKDMVVDVDGDGYEDAEVAFPGEHNEAQAEQTEIPTSVESMDQIEKKLHLISPSTSR